MIQNAVFDMGNVLIRFDPDYFISREGISDPEDRNTIKTELFQSVEWAMMDLGLLSEKTAEPLVMKRIPDHLKEKARNLLYNWALCKETIPGMEDLVHRISQAGYGVYLLSNASVSQPEYWKAYSISQYFHGTLISAHVKVVKPMNEIYHLFTEKFELKPENCVFIDDLPINVASAIANGWHGIVFHGDALELEFKMQQLGMRF